MFNNRIIFSFYRTLPARRQETQLGHQLRISPPISYSSPMALVSRLPLRLSSPSPPSSSSTSPLLPPTRNSPPFSSLITTPTSTSAQFPSLRFAHTRALPLRAALTASSPSAEASGVEGGGTTSKVLLEVKDLKAVITESRKEILHGVNLTIREGEVHAIMGKNGSGKSTFSKVLVGHPDYEVTEGTVTFKGENLLDMDPEERSHSGLFMSFQTPVEIPGVSNIDFLQMAYNARRKKLGLPELSPIEFFGFLSPKLAAVNMNPNFLNRNVNEGFSGGEKKRNEILQLAVLEAELAILDEIDSGLDIDALQDVAKAVNGLLTSKNSILMITHYQRLLDYIRPNYVHIMEDGVIVKTGGVSLAKLLEEEGYRAFSTM